MVTWVLVSNRNKDTAFFSMNQNLGTDWITSLDFGLYEPYTPNFIYDTDIYLALTGTNNLFCAVKLNVDNGRVIKFNWYNYTSLNSTETMKIFIVSIIYDSATITSMCRAQFYHSNFMKN